MTSFPGRIFYYLIPCLLLVFLIVIEWLRILAFNDSIFSYTLDDPYIHLTLAKHIRIGEYGINQGEISSPSSSILWPFILTPFSYFSFFEFIPLFLNSLLSLFILAVFISLCLSVDSEKTKFQWKNLLLFCLLIPSLNLIGQIFSGMEHSLQILCSVLLMFGIIFESRTGNFPLWLALVIIAGPLVRYENLALCVPALIFLFYRGHKKKVIYTSLSMVALLGLFSLFLLHIGQPPLAASILNKVGFGLHSSWLNDLFDQFTLNLTQRQALVFFILLLTFTYIIFFSKLAFIKKQLLTVITFSLLLHLFFGKFNWFHRYELYLHAAILLLVFYLYFDSYHKFKKPITWYALFVLGLVLACYPYFTVLVSLPRATNNIYQQQYQMRKFVIKWLKSPVAVNDIGWVSFDNPNYVLDLWGLGSYDTYKKRSFQKNSLWMVQAVNKTNVKLVMLYKDWFYSIPSNWVSLGCLYFNGPRVAAANNKVNFYATDAKYVHELKRKLTLFIKELPSDDEFNVNCE